MEQRTIRLNFDLSFVYGPRTLRVPLVAALLLAAVGELNSESVTLSTYYPAPSGVYTQMITTGDTYLARDTGGVSIGNSPIGTYKLSVTGNTSVTGYSKINATGCSLSAAVANGSVCGAGYYATFQPGVYTEGTSYQNMPSPFLITPNLTRIYKFVGINPADGEMSAMSTGYVESIRVACCPK